MNEYREGKLRLDVASKPEILSLDGCIRNREAKHETNSSGQESIRFAPRTFGIRDQPVNTGSLVSIVEM